MYISKNHPRYAELNAAKGSATPAATADPPKPTGDVIARFPRTNRDKGEEELRISLDSYQGHSFLSARIWTQDARTREWWPSRKGVSVRLSEAEGVADALMAGLRIADRRKAEAMPRGANPVKNKGNATRPLPAATEAADQPSRDFDEFNGG